MVAGGSLLFLLGAGRLVVAHGLSGREALYCSLLVIPAWLLLMVIAYVVQHAVMVSVIPVAAVVMWGWSSAAFDVALGLALMGIVAESAWSERKCEAAPRKHNDGADGVGEERG